MFHPYTRLSGPACAAALALSLAACGGGGGSADVTVPTGVRTGTASAASDLSATNAGNFVGPMARALMGAADGNTPGLSSGREAPQAVSATSGTPGFRWVKFSAGAAARALAASAREQAQATSTQVLACPFGGSITLTVDDADNNGKLSGGDTASFVFNACVAEQGLPPANGTLSFRVNAVELDSQDQPTALDATFTLTGFVETGFGSISGNFRVWFKDEGSNQLRQRVSYLNASVLEGAQTVIYDFDLYGLDNPGGSTFDLNGAIGIGGQVYALTSDVLSVPAGSLPASGTVTLRDAAGDALILRARSALTFDLEFRAAGAANSTVIAAGLAYNSYRLGGS